RTRNAGHLCLTTKLSVRTDLASNASHFSGERVELIDHGVDGVLQLKNFSFYVHGDLAGQIATSNSRRDFSNVSHLTREVAGHSIDRVSEILPGTSNARHIGLTTQSSFGSDFASDARHLSGKRAQLLDHGVECFFKLQNFAANVDRNFFRKIAGGYGGCHFCNVSYLTSEVAGHEVHIVGEILPRSRDARHVCLSTESAFCSDFA